MIKNVQTFLIGNDSEYALFLIEKLKLKGVPDDHFRQDPHNGYIYLDVTGTKLSVTLEEKRYPGDDNHFYTLLLGETVLAETNQKTALYDRYAYLHLKQEALEQLPATLLDEKDNVVEEASADNVGAVATPAAVTAVSDPQIASPAALVEPEHLTINPDVAKEEVVKPAASTDSVTQPASVPAVTASQQVRVLPLSEDEVEYLSYLNEVAKIEGLLKQKKNDLKYEETNRLLQQLLDEVKFLELEGTEPVDQLKTALSATYDRLIGKTEMMDGGYEKVANKMQGSPNVGLQILGGIMIALAFALVITCAIFLPEIVVGAAVIAGATAAATGVTISATVIGLGAGGFIAGFFGSRTGVSEDMSQLDKAVDSDHLYTPLSA